MAQLVLARPKRRQRPRRRHRHPKAFLATDTGLKLELPYAPREVAHDGLADVWTTTDRAGRKPLVTRTAEGLRTFSFDALVANADHQDPVEDVLRALKRVAESGARCTVSYSELERGVWRLTGLSVKSELRQHGTNAVTRATVSLTFVEAVDAVVKVGPLSGGHKSKGKAGRDRFYIWRKGDTLTAVARHFYGDGSKWPVIAKANHIKDPRAGKIKPGLRLRIPAL